MFACKIEIMYTYSVSNMSKTDNEIDNRNHYFDH